MRAQRDLNRLLGLHARDRRERPRESFEERERMGDETLRLLKDIYDKLRRNPDGSAVLTDHSTSAPPVDDPSYCYAIAHPEGPRITPARQERIDKLRMAVREGLPWDEVEQAAMSLGISKRQARSDVLLLQEQLRDEGAEIRGGGHWLQSISLAEKRNEMIYQLCDTSGDAASAAACEWERCRLLGMTAADRAFERRELEKRDAADRQSLPRKPAAPGTSRWEHERVFEIEFARLDRQAGHRHTAAELLARPDGRPGVANRYPWRPPDPAKTTPEWREPADDWDPADYLGDDLPPDYGDPNKRPEGVDPFISP